jgi:hypothetical protein
MIAENSLARTSLDVHRPVKVGYLRVNLVPVCAIKPEAKYLILCGIF